MRRLSNFTGHTLGVTLNVSVRPNAMNSRGKRPDGNRAFLVGEILPELRTCSELRRQGGHRLAPPLVPLTRSPFPPPDQSYGKCLVTFH